MAVTLLSDRSALARFTVADPSPHQDQASILVMSATVLLALLLGIALARVEVLLPFSLGITQSQSVTIHLQQMVAPVPPEPVPVLEAETILSAPEDRTPVQLEKPSSAAPQEQIDEPAPPAPRRVYGVRKVYARGLGSGASQPSGLVRKLGNTIDGRVDTLIATPADLQGELASLSSVDKVPEPLRRVKPVYSLAMLKARVRGVVTAYLLVDVDGTVKAVNVTEDIGLDSRQVASKALGGFRFKPAFKNGSPVAVWILHHVRFEFQE